MLKLGLIINPVAGIGGKVGLKGSDGEDIVARAKELGACRESGIKAGKALKEFADYAGRFALYTCAGPMGQDAAEKYQIHAEIIYGPGSRGRDTGSRYSRGRGFAVHTQPVASGLYERGLDELSGWRGDMRIKERSVQKRRAQPRPRSDAPE